MILTLATIGRVAEARQRFGTRGRAGANGKTLCRQVKLIMKRFHFEASKPPVDRVGISLERDVVDRFAYLLACGRRGVHRANDPFPWGA